MSSTQILKRAQEQPQKQTLDQSWGMSVSVTSRSAILSERELIIEEIDTLRGAVSQENKSILVISC
jgi:hypothetical protein